MRTRQRLRGLVPRVRPVRVWSCPTWPRPYGGLDLSGASPARSTRCCARTTWAGSTRSASTWPPPALFAHGTEEQRLRYLPPIVRNEEVWCQLFSEPGSGSDLASLATRAVRDGDDWVVTGQKVWTTWAHLADFAVLLARTDPGVPKREGITYFLLDLHQPGVDVRPLRHMGGEVDFNEVFLDGASVPDAQRVGDVGGGWKVANATLSGERQMVSGSGSGGVDRIGGSGAEPLIRLARRSASGGPAAGTTLCGATRSLGLWGEERVREWTNQRVAGPAAGRRPPGPESSIGKVHQGSLNQRIQLAAADLLGRRGHWPGQRRRRGERCRTRCRACCAAGPTPSRAAPPRSTRTSSANGSSACPASPIPGRARPGSDVPRS